MPNIVNGFISQFVTDVITMPLGRLPTFLMLLKSTLSIMGKIISQMSKATGIETLAYSNLLSVLGITGSSCPRVTPATMQRLTQRLRYRSKKLIPDLFSIVDIGRQWFSITNNLFNNQFSKFVIRSLLNTGVSDVGEAVHTPVIISNSAEISALKAFQKPLKDGITLLNAIQDVYLDEKIGLA